MKTILQRLEMSKLRNLILSASCFLGVGFAKKTNGFLCRIHAEKAKYLKTAHALANRMPS